MKGRGEVYQELPPLHWHVDCQGSTIMAHGMATESQACLVWLCDIMVDGDTPSSLLLVVVVLTDAVDSAGE